MFNHFKKRKNSPFSKVYMTNRENAKMGHYFKNIYGINTSLRLDKVKYYQVICNNIKHWTDSRYNTFQKCPECGILFLANKNQKYCSRACSVRVVGRKKEQLALKLAYSICKPKDIKEFYAKWTPLAMSEIYKCNMFHDDLIEYWQIKGVYPLRFCIQNKMDFNSKKLIRVIQKFIKWAFLHIKRKRKNEIFYDECSYVTQQKILGTCIGDD